MHLPDLERFIHCFNDFNPAIKFTWNISDDSMECLAVIMPLSDEGIGTSIRIPIHIYISLLINWRIARIRYRIPSFWDCGRCVRLILILWIKVKRWLVSSKPEATLSMSLNRLGPNVCLYLNRTLWRVRLKWILIFHKKSLWFYLSTIALLKSPKLSIKMLR